MRAWPVRRWFVAAAVAALAAVLIGVPTGVIPTPFYHRVIPVQWWNYPVTVVSAVLEGLLAATYLGVPRSRLADGAKAQRSPRSVRAVMAGALSAIAVGCPVCNKLVVLAIGVSGALSYFAPAQPVLAVVSLALLGHALRRRMKTDEACPVASS